VKILADAYGYAHTLPSTFNTAHVSLDWQTGTLLVQGGVTAQAFGQNDSFTINVVGLNIRAQVNSTVEFVPLSAVNQVVIASNGGNDTFNVSLPPSIVRRDVHYVVSSNQDSADIGNPTDFIVDLDAALPGAQIPLRAAIVEAHRFHNPPNPPSPRGIYVPRGKYNLALTGAEGAGTNDLDITSHISIVGTGAGETVINGSALNADGIGPHDRIFEVNGAPAKLELSGLTLTGATSSVTGGALFANNGAGLELNGVAVVGNTATGSQDGGGIRGGIGSNVIVRNSVFTGNSADVGGAIYTDGASLTIASTVFGLNTATSQTRKNVFRHGINTTLVNEGRNLADDNQGNVFSTALGDYIGTVNYIVTGVADSYDRSDDAMVRSIRDAIGAANTTAGAQEIWLPAWKYALTRERDFARYPSDTDVSIGDLDIHETLILRGVSSSTSVAWRFGAQVDAVFDLIGDFNGDGISSADDGNVDSVDWVIWRDTLGSTTDLRADADDNRVVNDMDRIWWRAKFGYTLTRLGIA
jgi:predicted outer membrane repeat protein